MKKFMYAQAGPNTSIAQNAHLEYLTTASTTGLANGAAPTHTS
ncbi:MAG: hypothetical protein WC791_03425 [Candidatus Paceibacterota bacterium]|jgi:hypothetical protein